MPKVTFLTLGNIIACKASHVTDTAEVQKVKLFFTAFSSQVSFDLALLRTHKPTDTSNKTVSMVL